MEFWQLVRIIRRNWKLIGILVIVCVVISLFLNLTKVKLYEASSLIQVSFSTTNELEGTPDYETKFTLFGTIQQAATSDLALRTVAQKNGIPSDNIKTLRQTIKVLPVEKSEYLKITVTAGSEKAAVGAANDLAAYVKDASNKRWLNQLDGILKYSEGQLKTAQDNYQSAIQGYDEAKKKYADLAAQAQQEDSDAQAKQIAEANNKVIAAQDAYSKANSTIPKDTAAIDLAKSNLDRAQRDLDALQQAALGPTDSVKQAQRSAELNQNSGLDDALNREKNAKSKVDQLQGQIDLAKSLQSYPDLHAASVTIVDPARSAESQGSQLPLFVGAAVIVALALGIVLAVLINYLDRGLHSVGTARDIYRQPVLAGIPLFRPDKNAKKKLALGKKGKAEPTALPEPISAEELTGLPEHAMESFRMLANSVVNRHHNQIPTFTVSQVRAALPAGVSGAENITDGEVPVKTNGNGNGNGNGNNHGLALAELSEVRDMVVDPGGTTQPHPVALLVTASAAGAGKTTVVANLGTALAEAGYRTLLIDCNRRNPALLSSFGLNGNGKDKDKKKKDQPEEQHVGEPGRVYNTEYPELDLLPYSSLPVQPSGVVRLADMAAMLHKLEGDYQLMICDTPALSEASDAMGLVQHFPNVIYVVDGRKANVAQDQEKLHGLTVGDASLEGLVVNWMQKQS